MLAYADSRMARFNHTNISSIKMDKKISIFRRHQQGHWMNANNHVLKKLIALDLYPILFGKLMKNSVTLTNKNVVVSSVLNIEGSNPKHGLELHASTGILNYLMVTLEHQKDTPIRVWKKISAEIQITINQNKAIALHKMVLDTLQITTLLLRQVKINVSLCVM